MAQVRAFIFAVLVMAAASTAYGANVSVSARISGVGWCQVQNTQNIAFGALNPLDPENVQATGSVGERCLAVGSTFTVSVTQVTPAPLFLTNGPANTIPYTLDVPTSASVSGGAFIQLVNITIPITAHIQGTDYQLAQAGAYTDTVTLQITP
jgi:spore coat protein U-like protein